LIIIEAEGAVMKSRIVSFCTVLAMMAVVLGLAGCPEFFQNNNGKKDGSDPVDPADIPVTGISLTKSSLTLAVGDSEKLEYTITPADATNKKVSWSSDKSDVVSVGADGTVTAHKTGEAIITVTTEDGGKTASVTVNVVTSVPVTGITLNKSSVTLAVGDLEKLEYTITPSNATNKKVSWSSDKSDVVSVGADGTVTAHKTGEAEITVTTEDGGKTASVTVTVVTSVPVTGITLNKSSVTLTIHSSEKVNFTITPANATNKNVTWTSSNTSVATVASDGTVTAVGFSSGGGNQFKNGPATGTATITATTVNGGKTAAITITTTTAAQVNLSTLPPLKDQFSEYFMMGNIFNPGDVSGSSVTNARLTRHFNILTAENNMKPSYISSAQGSYNWTTADSMVNAARASGFQVVGHTLLWHSQNASWMTSSSCTLANMKTYITAVVDHFKGKIYSWDVLNEVFPDGVSATADWKTAMRTNNPWFDNQGYSFVYEGYLAARLADPDAILYYNDYNLDNPGKATMVRDMVRDVNQQYAAAYPGETRKLIEGIGMQSHHNTNVTKAHIKVTLDLFKPLGVRISVSELDVLGQSYQDFASVGAGANKHGSSTVTNSGLLTQARLYGEYMALFIEYADIIERVSLWGITDNQSWRSAGLPLLFDPDGKAKPAYYQFAGALE
jgi:endo-1,4-beta-xylanase